jgi:hypothetical protein
MIARRMEDETMRIPILMIVLLLGLAVPRCAFGGGEGANGATHVRVAAGDLEAVFVDNGAFGEHRAGYNGIASLRHTKEPRTLFVPQYAGFNLEHVFGGDELADLFEPRKHAMTIEKRSDSTVVLHQTPTPLSSVESTTTFSVRGPHYIDIEFDCVAHRLDFFRHGYLGLFWASYINEPEDRSIHFLGRDEAGGELRWIAAFSETHGVKSTHRHSDDRKEFFFADNFNATLANHFSGYRYAEPFYYGRFNGMVFIYMWDRSEGIRFSQSPTGGGKKNPAWDFQFIVPDPVAGTHYGFRSCLVYKPFVSADDVLAEYRRWKGSLSKKR